MIKMDDDGMKGGDGGRGGGVESFVLTGGTKGGAVGRLRRVRQLVSFGLDRDYYCS